VTVTEVKRFTVLLCRALRAMQSNNTGLNIVCFMNTSSYVEKTIIKTETENTVKTELE